MIARGRPLLSTLRFDRLVYLLPFVAIIGWALILVLAHSTGRIDTPRAAILLAFPIVALGVALRPSWVVLFLITAPLAQVPSVPMRGLVVLLVATLVAQLAWHGRISLGWKSGFAGLALLLGSSLVFRADLSP